MILPEGPEPVTEDKSIFFYFAKCFAKGLTKTLDGSWEVVCDGTDWVECEGADGGGVGVGDGVDWAAWGEGALF